MALSMEEQRILDEMERKLADEDPRLASRLATFGQPRLPGMLTVGRARAVVVLISLALVAAATLMIYAMRPFPPGQARHSPPAQRTSIAPGQSRQVSASQATIGGAPASQSPAVSARPLIPRS